MATKPKELNERDTKIVQWLNEAYAKEAELEADLTAHISLTQKPTYKKRLQQHLKETREHKRAVARRIKQLGGVASATPLPGVPHVVGEAAGKTVAAVKGQVGAARALVTEQSETHMRNAQEELREEHVEIALYTRIETLATEVGDRETAQLAKGIRRDEERMAKFLTAELPRLVKEVVRNDIPRDQRATARRSTSARARTGSGTSRRTTSSSRSASTSSTSRRSGSSGSGTSNGSSASSRPARSTRSTSARSTSARSTSGRSTGARSTGGRSTSGRSTSARSSGARSTSARSTGARSTSARSNGSSSAPRSRTRSRSTSS